MKKFIIFEEEDEEEEDLPPIDAQSETNIFSSFQELFGKPGEQLKKLPKEKTEEQLEKEK